MNMQAEEYKRVKETIWYTCQEVRLGNLNEAEATKQILNLIPQYEPVQLEMLEDEKIRKYYLGSRLSAVKDAIQATNEHNLKINGGTLYRIKR